MTYRQTSDIIFQHLIDFPHCECVFCSTRQPSTGRIQLFLIFNERKRIYQRNATKETWDEIKDSQDYELIRACFNKAIEQRRIPCFTL